MRHCLLLLVMAFAGTGFAQDLTLNDLEYFERQGVNVLVFSNSFNGGFNDEKNSGILNVGGFFDAGDFDIETGSNINVVQNFICTWELFHPQRDETFVSQQQRYVELHRPDGVPDILQFIEHGVLNLVTQAEQIGHMASTLSNSVLDNYHHLGDAASITDGLHYDPKLKPYEVSADGKRSGTPDDMWAFTTRNPRLDIQAADVFTSAARPKQVFYGNNRADFSAIPGNVAPGLLFRKPDHFENYDDWPFLWGQNEGTIAGNTQYVIFGSSLKNIVAPK